MRYLLLLVFALASTIVWQTSVVADNPVADERRCNAAETPADPPRTTTGADEPECE